MRRFVRRGEITPKKTGAKKSAKNVLAADLRAELIDLLDNLEYAPNEKLEKGLLSLDPNSEVSNVIKNFGPRFDSGDLYGMIARYGGRADKEVMDAFLLLALLTDSPVRLVRLKTLTKKRGPQLGVNAYVGGGLAEVRGYELEGHTYDFLER